MPDMRNLLLLAAVIFILPAVNARTLTGIYRVMTVRDDARDTPVVLPVPENWVRSAVVKAGGREIPSQLDDLDRDGMPENLAFTIDLTAGKAKRVQVVWSSEEAPPDRYPKRVHAQMFLKEDGGVVPETEITATQDNMYNALWHHGPAFESEQAAYRIYFDRKQTVDLYGKRYARLELAETMWYPSDEQLEQGYGDDIIRVFGAVGVGTLKGWNPDKGVAVHVDPMVTRTARVLSAGPVRAVVEMDVKGWLYRGRHIDVVSRYTIWAGHRDAQVENFISGDTAGLVFCTGVMKIAEHVSRIDGRGMAAVWGTDFPVNDTVKYARQTCGIAVSIPGEYIAGRSDDKLNYLYLLRPGSDGCIRYRMTMSSLKETYGYRSAEEFFGYVEAWDRQKTQPVYLTRR